MVFAPEQFPKLRVEHPPLWWPYQMGEPHLEALRMSFRTGGKVSDERVAQVGIREVTSELTDKGARLFQVNGKPVLSARRRLVRGHAAARAAAAAGAGV